MGSHENVLNITDSFQYRIESLLEEEDLLLNITPNTDSQKNTKEKEPPLRPWHTNGSQIDNSMLIKSNYKMRRKSDTSSWSGGIAELDRKTFFWTFEYIAKPINVYTDKLTPTEVDEILSNDDTEGTKYRKRIASMGVSTSPMAFNGEGMQQSLQESATIINLETRKNEQHIKITQKSTSYLQRQPSPSQSAYIENLTDISKDKSPKAKEQVAIKTWKISKTPGEKDGKIRSPLNNRLARQNRTLKAAKIKNPEIYIEGESSNPRLKSQEKTVKLKEYLIF